jgi:hypothetical protein
MKDSNSFPKSEKELMEIQTDMLVKDGKSWEEVARLYGEMLVEARNEQARLINQKNRLKELLRIEQQKKDQ